VLVAGMVNNKADNFVTSGNDALAKILPMNK
jgi:hypothetical protein